MHTIYSLCIVRLHRLVDVSVVTRNKRGLASVFFSHSSSYTVFIHSIRMSSIVRKVWSLRKGGKESLDSPFPNEDCQRAGSERPPLLFLSFSQSSYANLWAPFLVPATRNEVDQRDRPANTCPANFFRPEQDSPPRISCHRRPSQRGRRCAR